MGAGQESCTRTNPNRNPARNHNRITITSTIRIRKRENAAKRGDNGGQLDAFSLSVRRVLHLSQAARFAAQDNPTPPGGRVRLSRKLDLLFDSLGQCLKPFGQCQRWTASTGALFRA